MNQNKFFFTGIGSRNINEQQYKLLRKISQWICSHYNSYLRSGHAPGADQACEKGSQEHSEIYLPWNNFGTKNYTNKDGALMKGRPILGIPFVIRRNYKDSKEFKISCKIFHDRKAGHLENCRETIQKLMTRNVYQILGYDLNWKSKFVLCCYDETKRSGTQQAIYLAQKIKIPIINIFNNLDFDNNINKIEKILGGINEL